MMKAKIQHTNKAGVKKKIDLIESKPIKSRAVIEKKPPLKSEIIAQFKVLQVEHDTLKHENNKNLMIIKKLEEKLSVLQQQKSPSLSGISQELQTYSSDIQICCNVCIYIATCEEELNWHMSEAHDLSSDHFDQDNFCDICERLCKTESDLFAHKKEHQPTILHNQSNRLNCNFCEDKFDKIGNLIAHKKKNHSEKVAICWQFTAGICEFGDTNCWFVHSQIKRNNEAVQFKCRSCEKTCISQSEFMRHRKQDHENIVPLCKNWVNGTCTFESTKCWFNHENQEKNNESENHEKSIKENKEVIEKVLDMMEKFAERIQKVEQHNES